MEQFKELERLAKPMKEYLEKNYHPHCAVVITMDNVKVVETKMSSPLLKK